MTLDLNVSHRIERIVATMSLFVLAAGPICAQTVPVTPQPLGAAASPGAALSTPSPAAVAVSSDYRVDIDDTISITVARHGDVNGSFRIPPDGLIILPRLLTPIDARGKTAAELTTEITGKLVNEGKLNLHAGQVAVTVVGLRVHRVFVRGSAIHGGDYDLKPGWRVADLVALMGSVPQPDRVRARLTNPARSASVTINLSAALADPAGTSNPVLQEGDTLTLDLPQEKRLLVTGEGPKGEKEFEDWMGLKRALLSIGFTAVGGSGDLTEARLIRHANPEDINSPATYIPVNLLKLLTDDNAVDIPFNDRDTLDIPLSQKFVFVGGAVGNIRKWYMPQDRKVYLTDVFTSTGEVAGNAAIGRIQVARYDDKDQKWEVSKYDLGRFMSKADMSQNPEIFPNDMIYVPTSNKTDYVGNIWTGYGLYSLFKVFVPGMH